MLSTTTIKTPAEGIPFELMVLIPPVHVQRLAEFPPRHNEAVQVVFWCPKSKVMALETDVLFLLFVKTETHKLVKGGVISDWILWSVHHKQRKDCLHIHSLL